MKTQSESPVAALNSLASQLLPLAPRLSMRSATVYSGSTRRARICANTDLTERDTRASMRTMAPSVGSSACFRIRSRSIMSISSLFGGGRFAREGLRVSPMEPSEERDGLLAARESEDQTAPLSR